MYNIDDCPNLRCIDCKFNKANAEFGGQESACKRINHKDIKFYKPWFKSSYDGHLICCDFEPAHPEYADFKDKWTNFDDFWAVYKDAWLTDLDKRGIAFFVNNDLTVGYRVPLEKFIYGNMVCDGILQATEKFFFKQSRKSPTGYELVTEKINGVPVKSTGGFSMAKSEIIVEPKSGFESTMFKIASNNDQCGRT